MSETALSIVKSDAMPIPQPQSETAAILNMIERAARDPAVDLNKLERLYGMHQDVQRRNAETAFNAAMAAAQMELEPVGRASRNTHTNSSYADLATVSEAATPIIAKHGFGLSFGTATPTMPDHIKMVCDVTHTSGHTKRYESEFPYDLAGSAGKVNKTKIQAFGSTTTYGRRYMMLLIFNISTADNDGNAPRQRKSSAEAKRDGSGIRANIIRQEFVSALNVEMLRHLGDLHRDEISEMPPNWQEFLRAEYEATLDTLKART